MPNRTLLICAGIGLLVIGAMVGGGLFASRGAHLELQGSVRKTRVAALSPTRTVVVLDFRASNPADYPFVVKTVEVEVTLADGRKEIGQFVPGEKIGKKETVERMAAASFNLPEAELEARKGVLLRLRDVDGPVSELR